MRHEYENVLRFNMVPIHDVSTIEVIAPHLLMECHFFFLCLFGVVFFLSLGSYVYTCS